MSTNHLTLSSTSDTPEQVNSALGIKTPATTEKTEVNDEGDGESDGAPSGDESTEKPAGEKKKGGFQKRIDKLTGRALRAETEAQLLREQLAGKPAEKPTEKTPAVDASKKPVAGDFAEYEDFIEALADWKYAQNVSKANQETQKTQQETARAALIEQHTGRLDTAREKYSDFDEVTDQELPISQAMQDVIFESETGAELAYWLGKNPDECKRISRLTPTAAARELGKVEATLGTAEPASGAAETPKPKVTSAPAPIKPVGAKSKANVKDPKDMSLSEYRAYRESGGGK